MSNVIDELYEVTLERKTNPEEGSYTCYLFAQGLDKILKKCGEEMTEVIIAAKNGAAVEDGTKDALIGEIGDVMYHLIVLMAQTGISMEDLYALLGERRKKIGNLKPGVA